jgi:spore coat polysaccharide biosynthesis protein SpsF
MSFKTEQEDFWAGDFGEEYIKRNSGDKLLASNLNFFAHSLKRTNPFASCIEFGPNLGMNLKALKLLYPDLKLSGVEINKLAAERLKNFLPDTAIYKESIIDFIPKQHWDLVLVKGVLIHINPAYLKKVFDNLYKASSRYILLAEYYSRNFTSMDYRGHKDKLFKSDFCGDLLDQHNNLQLIDYGFVYHRDTNFPQDDISWFLLEKVIK